MNSKQKRLILSTVDTLLVSDEQFSIPFSAIEEKLRLTEEDQRNEIERVIRNKYRRKYEISVIGGSILFIPKDNSCCC